MTKNVDPDKYKYQSHRIGFDSTRTFTHPKGRTCKNIIIFGVDMTNSKHANNKAKDVLVLGKGLIQKIDETTIYAEKMYSPDFTIANKTFCLSLDIMVMIVIYLLMTKKSSNFRLKTKVY